MIFDSAAVLQTITEQYREHALSVWLVIILWVGARIIEPVDVSKKELHHLRLISLWLILILCLK